MRGDMADNGRVTETCMPPRNTLPIQHESVSNGMEISY